MLNGTGYKDATELDKALEKEGLWLGDRLKLLSVSHQGINVDADDFTINHGMQADIGSFDPLRDRTEAATF